ncbi:hypothetical protein SNE40_013084 [Patella caerulea]|uniref:Reverse transcriptase domain-containing protein n=1 Tax=Patella caerulea TaxID=87958 RepID=A0AAN8JLH3_PATCE
MRIKEVLNNIISIDQTSSVPNRNIANNICAIRDIIDILINDNTSGFVIQIDQTKAFDLIDHDYLSLCLGKVGFGQFFINSIKLLYRGIKSCVLCNGHLSRLFAITRGIRQGCPISALLFVVVAETLHNIITNNKEIKGININPQVTSTIFQHADDSTFTVKDIASVHEVLDTTDIYSKASGGQINFNKTVILVIGPTESDHIIYSGNTINFDKNCTKILGVYLGPNKILAESLNWKEVLSKIKNVLNLWSKRSLTLKGKALILNTLAASKLWYRVAVLDVPEWVERTFKNLILDFLWNKKPPLIKYSTIIGSLAYGGLNIPDLKLKKYAMRLNTLGKYTDHRNDHKWKQTMTYFLRKYHNMSLDSNILYIKYDKNYLCNLPAYYSEMLCAWDEINNGLRPRPSTLREILVQPLFHNPLLSDKTGTFNDLNFIKAGFTTVADLAYEVIPGFYHDTAVIEEILRYLPDANPKLLYRTLNKIHGSLPGEWTYKINNEIVPSVRNESVNLYITAENQSINISRFTVKLCYTIFVMKCFMTPTSTAYWENYSININHEHLWKSIHCTYKGIECINNDFKVAHNCIFTNEKLFKCNKITTPNCSFCNNTIENIIHLFKDCSSLQGLIKEMHSITEFFLRKKGYSHHDFNTWLLVGYPYTKNDNVSFFLVILFSVYRLSISKRRLFYIKNNSCVNLVRLFKSLLCKHLLYVYNHCKLNNNIQWFTKMAKSNPYMKIVQGEIKLCLD